MQLVKNIMTRKVYCLGAGDSLKDAYEIMKTCQVTHVPVVMENKVVGMVSRGDVLLHATYDEQTIELEDIPLGEVMTKSVVTCLPSASVADIAATMICCRIEAVPVVNVDKELIGIITSTDLLDYLCMLEEETGRSVMPIAFAERDPTSKVRIQVQKKPARVG